jgi:hypothetical protein
LLRGGTKWVGLHYLCFTNQPENLNLKTMTAAELKIGDTFKKEGHTFKVVKLTPDTYKNGTPCLIVECTMNGGSIADSFFSFKLGTKIK